MHSIANKSVAAMVAQRSVTMRAPTMRVTTRRVMPVMAATFAPPTVTKTKDNFMRAYSRPVAPVYNTVLQELLVQQHFIRFNIKYVYNPIYALGVVSAFDQIMESMKDEERTAIFDAYILALDEKSSTYRADAEELEKLAGELSGPEGLVADASGNSLQKALATVAESSAEGKFGYNKFFAIGLFRLLELTGAKEPSALETLVKAVGVKPENVNRDLTLYKGILSKLSAAKELMAEFLVREKRKQAERDAEKAAKASKSTEEKKAETPAIPSA
eukprot:gene18201-24643_t